MFDNLDKRFLEISESEPVQFFANKLSKLRQALIGPEKTKAENIEKYIEAVRIIGLKTKNYQTLTEGEFLALVGSTLKDLGMNDWNVEPVNEQLKHSDRYNYVSFRENGGYNLWLQIQQGQKSIFCQRSFSDVKGVM